MTRRMIGGLDLSTIDENEADTQYIFDEVFGARIYHHDAFRLPDDSVILDVGANEIIGRVGGLDRIRRT